MSQPPFSGPADRAAELIRRFAAIEAGSGHILVSSHTGSIAHSGRARHVADALSQLGIRITKAGDCAQAYSESILGVDPGWNAPMLATDHISTYARHHCSWGFYDKYTLMEHVLAWRQLIQREQFDVVVGDFSIPAILAAESLGIRTVTIQNALWTSAFHYRLRPPEDHVIQRAISRLGLGWFSRMMSDRFGATNVINGIYQRQWARPYNSVRRALGLKPRSTYYANTEGDLVIIPDLPKIWEKYGTPSSPKYVAIGPIIWEPEETSESQGSAIRQLIESGRPFIYATLGSSGTEEMFGLLLETFRQRRDGLALALTSGGQFQSWEGWSQKPDNVFLDAYYPGRLVLGAAGCVAAINHGGSGSAYQALLTPPAKPTLMLPTHAEQQWNAEILEGMGFGVVISKHRRSPRELNRAIDRVLHAATPLQAHGYGLQA